MLPAQSIYNSRWELKNDLKPVTFNLKKRKYMKMMKAESRFEKGDSNS